MGSEGATVFYKICLQIERFCNRIAVLSYLAYIAAVSILNIRVGIGTLKVFTSGPPPNGTFMAHISVIAMIGGFGMTCFLGTAAAWRLYWGGDMMSAAKWVLVPWFLIALTLLIMTICEKYETMPVFEVIGSICIVIAWTVIVVRGYRLMRRGINSSIGAIE